MNLQVHTQSLDPEPLKDPFYIILPCLSPGEFLGLQAPNSGALNPNL